MASTKSTRKPNHLQPIKPEAPTPVDPRTALMRKLGLDWHSIDLLAVDYLNSEPEECLVLTIILLKRLLNLADLRLSAPESLDNYLATLIEHLYRATPHCEGAAKRFAEDADESQRSKHQPKLVSDRRAS